eukprot:TRINITY_DN4526_c1_g1_i1.p2 TRINITY_DN4526_c1_g1~~TRINITY_DN4526_c1_g1_i1.p2  ORF type:complete len:193 (-),score=12.65 TRINITY_DN4526_c1_g1_i1:155-733(-)
MSLVRSDPDTGELQGPQVRIGFSSRVFDVLKVRKKVNVGPVYFNFGVDYNRIQGKLRYHATCKDRILEGHFGIRLPDTRVEYRKLVPLPTGGGILIAGSFSPEGLLGNGFKPAFGFHYQIGGDGESLWTARGLDLRKTFYWSKHHGLEVCGNVRLPLPQPRYNLDGDDVDFQIDDDTAVEFNIAQINPVLRL